MKFILIIIPIVCSLITINVAFDLQPRIINGYPANFAQFPYFAFLRVEYKSKNNFMGCGATLINDNWLLTAAHCVSGADRLVATLGMTRLNNFFQMFNSMEIHVKKENIHVYPYYFGGLIWNDIALIQLPQKIRSTGNIRPVQMPNNCDSVANTEVFAVGHGQTENTEISLQLNFASLKTLPRKECVKTFPFILFRKSVICASSLEGTQSIYAGDSGGPLVTLNDTLIGISSFRRRNFFSRAEYDPAIPQAFTNILSYLKWIGEVTAMDLPNC